MVDQQQYEVAERIGGLLFKYVSDVIADEELAELNDWVYADKKNEELFEKVTKCDKFQELIALQNLLNCEGALRFIQSEIGLERRNIIPPTVKRRKYLPSVVAIFAGLIALGIGLYFGKHHKVTLEYSHAAHPSKSDASSGREMVILASENKKPFKWNIVWSLTEFYREKNVTDGFTKLLRIVKDNIFNPRWPGRDRVDRWIQGLAQFTFYGELSWKKSFRQPAVFLQ